MNHGRGEIFVSALESGARTMEKLGRHREKSLPRKAIGNIADMCVHSEGLLHDQQAARCGRARWARRIQPNGRAVAHLRGNKFALNVHCAPPRRFAEIWSGCFVSLDSTSESPAAGRRRIHIVAFLVHSGTSQHNVCRLDEISGSWDWAENANKQ